MRILSGIVIFYFVFFQAFSQGGYTIVTGKIQDKATQKALSEAYIVIPSTGFGTGTNHDGDFVFQFPKINLDSQVVVSLMGYKSVSFIANTLKPDSNVIEMEALPLINASLGISDAKVFVKSALDSIKNNYPDKASYQTGFFQELFRIQKLGFVKINEGIVKVERFPDPKKEIPDKVKLLRGRRLEWKGQTSKLEGWGFQNGTDIVCKSLESSIPDYFHKKNIDDYEFRIDSLMTTFDEIPLFVIRFKPIHKRIKAAREGVIYIDPETKAIARIEYKLTPEGVRDLVNVNSGPIKITGKTVEAYVQYRKFQGKWRLQDSQVSFVVDFEDKLDKKFLVTSDIVMRYTAFESRPLLRSGIYPNELLLSTNNFNESRDLGLPFWMPYLSLRPTAEMLAFARLLLKK